MQVGFGQEGRFDCSGLVIAGIAQVLGSPASDWPGNLRHTRQMAKALLTAGEQPRGFEGDH